MSKLAKLSQLFDKGVEVVIPANSGAVVVWVNKLNTFQVEECAHEGRVARARRMFAIKEIGTPEYHLFQSTVSTYDRDQLVTALADGKSNEFLYEVFQDIRGDKEWAERVEVMEHSSDDVADRPDDDPEKQVLDKIATEYQEEILKRLDAAQKDYRSELDSLSLELLRDRYLEQYLEREGLRSFQASKQQHELFHCLRQCEAEVPAEGESWDHTECDHSRRFLDEVSEVLSLPDEVAALIQEAFQGLTVPIDLARFMGGPASSSESSGPSSSAEDSLPSSPEAQSPTPGTTS